MAEANNPPELIAPIAKRRMILNGTTYAKGKPVPMTQQQYDADLGPKGLGWVELPAATAKQVRKGGRR